MVIISAPDLLNRPVRLILHLWTKLRADMIAGLWLTLCEPPV
jgi:hypothetical protein